MSTVSRKEIRFTKKEFIFVCLILVTIFSLFNQGGWLIYHDWPHKGEVVDAETNAPIEGAVVVAVWHIERYGIYGGLGGPVARFLNAKETTTDKNGEFVTPLMFGFHWWPFSTLDEPNVTVFKPGYTSYEWDRYPLPNLSKFPDGIIRLTKTKSREERIKAMTDAGFADNIPTKKILIFLNMMDKEYKQLKVGKSK